MRKPNPAPLVLTLFAIGALSLGGCATKAFVRDQVGAEDTKVGAVDSKVTADQARIDAHDAALKAHDARLADLDKNTRDALERADAAGKLAEGKFLYSVVLSDDGVKFAAHSAELSAEAKTRLLDFAQKLKTDNKNVYLEIQGHSDNLGSKASNTRIGAQRAEAVRRFLNEQGVPLSRMSTISYGGDSPVASNKTKAGRAQNRRVVIVVLA